MWRKKILLLTRCLLAAGLYWHFHVSGEADATKGKGKGAPVAVSLVSAKIGNMPVYLTGLGNVASPATAVVHSRVDGQLMRLGFREGQMVKEGDLLAELDARPFQAQLEQAEGQLMRDQALLSEASIDLQRYRVLLAQDSIAKQQVDLQESLVKQYEGAVRNDRGLVDNARLQITYSRVTAPIPGQVGLRQVDLGNIVHASDAGGIVTITQLQPITVIFTLPEDNIPQVLRRFSEGEPIVAEAFDRESRVKLAEGMITAVDNTVDPTTGTVKIRAEFPNGDRALFPSQFVNIRCRIDTQKHVVLVPAAAIQHGSQGAFVYKAKPDNTVTVQQVTPSGSDGDRVAVAHGVQEGDMIVADGADNLREGAKITVPEAPSAAPGDKTENSGKEPAKEHRHRKKDAE